MAKNSPNLEGGGDSKPGKSAGGWPGEHPYSSLAGRVEAPTAAAPPEKGALVFPDIFAGGGQKGATTDVPTPVQKAIQSGAPIRFSSTGEDQAANRQPDFYLTPEGKLVANPQAKPSADGSINIEIQSKDAQNNKSLHDAIQHETKMQQQAGKELARLFQQAHPGKPVPGWMTDLMNAKPNLPDFVPFPTQPGQQPAAPPENGFVPRGVSNGSEGGGGGGGIGGFAGNGGFDGNGNFRGNGGAGDGTISTGAASPADPIGPGEKVAAKDIYDYLTQKYQFSPAQASGILGNMMVESTLNTNSQNPNEGAIGLCQWEGGRRTALENFAKTPQEEAQAKSDGVANPVLDWKVQVDFMMHELNGSESNAMGHLKAAQTPEQAAAAFDQFYERSSGAARGQRVADASEVYKTVAKNA